MSLTDHSPATPGSVIRLAGTWAISASHSARFERSVSSSLVLVIRSSIGALSISRSSAWRISRAHIAACAKGFYYYHTSLLRLAAITAAALVPVAWASSFLLQGFQFFHGLQLVFHELEDAQVLPLHHLHKDRFFERIDVRDFTLAFGCHHQF